MSLKIKPIHLKQANEHVKKFHRHNLPTAGGKFAISCYDENRLCGVAICGIADDKIERITGKDINKNDKQSNQRTNL